MTIDGQLKFSKKPTGRFPGDDQGIAAGQALGLLMAPHMRRHQ